VAEAWIDMMFAALMHGLGPAAADIAGMSLVAWLDLLWTSVVVARMDDGRRKLEALATVDSSYRRRKRGRRHRGKDEGHPV
jgi:hypothetical protein